jgi:hypothetical protein
MGEPSSLPGSRDHRRVGCRHRRIDPASASCHPPGPSLTSADGAVDLASRLVAPARSRSGVPNCANRFGMRNVDGPPDGIGYANCVTASVRTRASWPSALCARGERMSRRTGYGGNVTEPPARSVLYARPGGCAPARSRSFSRASGFAARAAPERGGHATDRRPRRGARHGWRRSVRFGCGARLSASVCGKLVETRSTGSRIRG